MARVRCTRVATSVVVVWACIIGTAWAYSQGAPDTTCSTREPGHGVGRQLSTSPYTIVPGSVQVKGGERMLVTLQAPANDTFRGFLVQALASGTNQVTGTFFTTDHKYLNCGKGINNAVTHRGSSTKRKVRLMWEPPSDFIGDVIFTGCFVKEKITFWVDVTSEKVTVTKREVAVAPPPTTTTSTTTTTTSTTTTTTTTTTRPSEIRSLALKLVNIYDNCGEKKGCFGFPSGCEENNNCVMMMTYTKVSSGYKFEIMGTTSSGYVAAGLSDDSTMGKDSVMACRVLNGEADVVMAYNNGNSNELLTNSKYGLSDIQTLQIDGKVYCTFVRQAHTDMAGINFDLDSERFHLMLAMGPAEESRLRYHDNRIVSSGTVSMDKFESITAASEVLKTVHACLMIGAWICAASCGIILARYYKKTWLQNRCCGIDQWFHFHRFFMGLTWGLTVAGFILIVYYLQGWTKINPKQNPHAILGVITTGLCFIQPFMALCRCSPGHKNRPIFNWLHWFVGNSAQILGITAIFFGFELVDAPEWTTFILIIFIAFHCVVHLILSIGQCVSESKAEQTSNVYPMKDMNGSRSPLQPVEKRTDAPGSGFRKAMLALYFLINWLITAVLILIVVVGEETLKDWGIIFWEK